MPFADAADLVAEFAVRLLTGSYTVRAHDRTGEAGGSLRIAPGALVREPLWMSYPAFVFFAMEEDHLVGSREHVERLLREGSPPEGILSLDMIGYASSAPDSQKSPFRIPLLLGPPSVGDFVLVAGNFGSGWLGNLFEGCVDAYVPDLAYYSLNRTATWSSDAERVDAWNYWKNGIPAIALGDTSYHRNPHYHRATDTPDTLDFTFLRRNTQAVLATVLHWAEVRPAASTSSIDAVR